MIQLIHVINVHMVVIPVKTQHIALHASMATLCKKR